MNEGYLPLYRKYRPQKLDDIVGQAHIKRALSNAIQLNKIAHAYLFTGPRGTGKTSTARILAKSLNCVEGPTVTPCENCESCKAITNTIPIDVIEIDAASNRSVDDAHEILEKVQYAPVNGKYKIYIIDEVHMLTTQAFNALLKTLEEPPKNVIFILATTESHKVLDTIKSRCQRFDFKRITTNDIIEHLKKIAKAEKINISDSAISVIAKSSAGGMRDSLALLDQVSTMGESKEITEEDINNLLGRLSFESLYELTSHIVNSDGASAINSLEKIYDDGNEPIQILTNLMLFLKNCLIVKTCKSDVLSELTGLAEEQVSALSKLADSLEKHQILSLINKTADYIKEIKETTNQQMWLEVSLIDLSNLTENTKLADLEARVSALESGQGTSITSRVVRKVITPVPVQAVKKAVEVVEKPSQVEEPKIEKQEVQKETNVVETPIEKEIPQTAQVGKSGGGSDIKSLWVSILQSIPSQAERAFFQLANPVKINEDGIVITFKAPNWIERANSKEKKQCIIDAANVVLGKENIPVLVREPLPDDTKIEKVKINPPKKSVLPPVDLVDKNEEISQSEIETVNNENKTNNPQKPVAENVMRSDQSNMVRDLFDGKFLD